MEGGSIQQFPIMDLTGGMDPLARPGSLGPGAHALWTDMNNLRGHDGVLKRAEPLVAIGGGSGSPTIVLNTDSTAYANVQTPLLIRLFETNGGAARMLVITNREAFIWTGASWVNITPVYNVGTVNVTNGSLTVSAASGTPDWLNRGIGGGQLVQLPDGNWYYIDTCSSTTLTLKAAYTGPTASNQAYTIRRTFSGNGANGNGLAFAQIFNGDLYIAMGFSGQDSAVYMVPDVVLPTKLSWTSSEITFLVSGRFQFSAGLDFLGYYIFIRGMHILEDGRIVLGLHWWNPSTNANGQNRVLYSSHLNQAVWLTSPGGFTDLIQRSGELTALVRIPRGVAVHFSDGVVLGTMNGQDDPPLDFQGTRANVGTISPKTIATTPLGDIFIGSDRRLKIFDGNQCQNLSTGADYEIFQRGYDVLKTSTFIQPDLYRGELRIFFPEDPAFLPHIEASGLYQTKVVSVNLETLATRKSQYRVLVTAATENVIPANLGPYANQQRYYTASYVGIPSLVNGVVTSLVYRLSETQDPADLHPEHPSGSRGGIYADTDDLDFGSPMLDKCISHVTLWYRAKEWAGSEAVEVQISADSGLSWTSVSQTLSFAGKIERFAHFFFEPNCAKQWRVRLNLPDGNTMHVEFTRLIISFIPLNPVEAVER